jgi:spermidine synthase
VQNARSGCRSFFVIAWEQLGLVSLPTGEELTLSRRSEEYSVSVNDVVLMNSRSHYSEEQLAVLGCAHLQARPKARVLVGGLGMGFTLRAALDVLPADATVEVAELLAEVVEWNRGPLGHLAAHPLDDPRTWVRTEDVRRTLACANELYDAILLDVDNGPLAFTSQSNDALYTDDGLRSVGQALRPNGVLCLWSAWDDGSFTNRLRANGFHARKRRVPARPKGNFIHVLWLATKT